jgi:outer membrane protein TolC
MRNKPGIVLILLCVFVTYSHAQAVRNITLKEAINLSLENNKYLKVNQAKVDEAIAEVSAAKDKRLPGSTISGSYLRMNNADIDMKIKPSSGSGGSAQPGQSISADQAMYGILNVSLPLYTGGKIKYGIHSAELLAKAAELDGENQKEEVIATTIEAIANLFRANSAVTLVKESLEQNKQRVIDLSNLEKNGIIARNDLLKAQLQESNVELSMLDAENNLQIANLNMNIMLGLPDDTQLRLDTSGIVKSKEDRSLDDYIRSALAHRKDKEALGYQLDAANIGISVAKADKLPNLSLTGGYIAGYIPNVIAITNALNIGVGLSYNIASLWKTKSKIDQAQARVNQLKWNQSIMDDNLRLEVSKAYMLYTSFRKKIDVTEKARIQAEENYRIIKNKFDNQLATTTDLLEADVAKLQANINYTATRADTFVAQKKLLLSAGLLSQDIDK